MSVTTSRVFAIVPAAYQRLKKVAYPPHPTTNTRPSVVFVAPVGDPTLEQVTVFSEPTEPVTREPRSLGVVTFEEDVRVKVLITSDVPDTDPLRVWERLSVLSATTEAAFRDQTTGRIIPLDELDESNSVLLFGGPPTVLPRLHPHPDGFTGSVELTFSQRSRI